MPRLRSALPLLAVALTLPLAACEDGQKPVKDAKTEGVYVTAGGLKYQVQISRKLNPYDVEDRDYLNGVPNAAKQVAQPDIAWYGVFVRVENRTDDEEGVKPRTITPATKFYIEDTAETRVLPTPVPDSNPYAYRATPIKAGAHIPTPGSTAASAPIGGSLLLFKVPQSVLDNRPTKLHIVPSNGDEATITLDV